MTDEIRKFKNIVNYLVSQGQGVTEIAGQAGLTWPTVDAILKDKPTNFRASTVAKIQDFIKTHNTIPADGKVAKTEFEEDIKEDTNYGVLEFFVRVRELLQGVPKGYKCKIEIEKL